MKRRGYSCSVKQVEQSSGGPAGGLAEKTRWDLNGKKDPGSNIFQTEGVARTGSSVCFWKVSWVGCMEQGGRFVENQVRKAGEDQITEGPGSQR